MNITMKMTNRQYNEFIKTKAPKSPIVKNCVKAFLTGGLICAAGQVLLKLYGHFGLGDEDASTLVTVTLIFLSVAATGLDLYPKLAKHGGAGTLVPVTGFANAVAAPAIEAKTEGYVLGVGAKIFTIAGPVILFGTAASVLCGTLYFLWQLV